MSVYHLLVNGRALCAQGDASPNITLWPHMATCKRCIKRHAADEAAAAEAEANAALDARNRAAAERVGLLDAFDFLARNETPTGRMVANMFAAIAVGLDELGYRVTPKTPVAPADAATSSPWVAERAGATGFQTGAPR